MNECHIELMATILGIAPILLFKHNSTNLDGNHSSIHTEAIHSTSKKSCHKGADQKDCLHTEVSSGFCIFIMQH